jgi:hypothetical protein
MLEILIIGALMGVLGQGARAVVGLKGMADDAKALDLSPNDLFQAARLVTSFMIGFLVGLAAALVYIKNYGVVEPSNLQTLLGFAASGYLGTDFLEGFISQYLPQGAAGSAVSQHLAALRVAPFAQKTQAPTYSYPQAESIVLKAFSSLNVPNVTDASVLSDLNYSTSGDMLGLLDAVNEQIPNKAHLLPIGAVSSWKKVSDIVTSVEYAPTKSPATS